MSEIPRVALTPTEAAAAIGVSRSFFYANVLPDLQVIRRGSKVLILLSELQRWGEGLQTYTLPAR